MASSFKRNPRWAQQVASSREMKAHRRRVADKIAEEAGRLGRGVARSYRATVAEDDDRIRVEARTGGINAASWIEFGNKNMPAHAPLRKGAEAAGASMKASNRR